MYPREQTRWPRSAHVLFGALARPSVRAAGAGNNANRQVRVRGIALCFGSSRRSGATRGDWGPTARRNWAVRPAQAQLTVHGVCGPLDWTVGRWLSETACREAVGN